MAAGLDGENAWNGVGNIRIADLISQINVNGCTIASFRGDWRALLRASTRAVDLFLPFSLQICLSWSRCGPIHGLPIAERNSKK